MAFIVYATYSVAIGVFIFWFGVWMLHLIAIIYGKIRLHKKSRLYQKLHQHNLLQPRSRTSSGSGYESHHHHNHHHQLQRHNKSRATVGDNYTDLLLENDHNYRDLHQLMHHESSSHGPIPPAAVSSASTKHKLSSSTGLEGLTFVKGGGSAPANQYHHHHRHKSNGCDYASSLGGSGIGGRETIINLNCDEAKERNAASGMSASASSPDLALICANSASVMSGGSGEGDDTSQLIMKQSPIAAAVAASLVDPQLTLRGGGGGSDSSNGGSNGCVSSSGGGGAVGDALMRKSAVELANRLPKVSILKPLMGIDSNLAANLETFFTMDYPRQAYEILFCVESAEDPVLGLCQSLIDKYKGEVDARLFIGGEQVGVNPKINNMEPGWRAAKHELVMISDAGIKMKPDTLMDMVEHMTEKVALVHQMPFTCDREGFAATYEKIFFGTIQSRIYLASDCLNMICHTGMSCLFRKKVIEGLGGLRVFGCYLAEDFFMAKSIMEDGWKTTISSYPALQNSGVCDIKTFQNRLVRWAKLRIAMMSCLILLEPMSECMIVGAIASWGVSVLFHWDFLAFYLVHILCWFLSDWMLLTIVQNGSVSFNKFDFVVGWLFREISGPYLFFCALWNPTIRWRTRAYKLDWGGVANEISSSNKIKT